MNPEAQLATLFAAYDPPIADLGTALRAKLRARLPGFSEIVYVYESQTALVISYSATEHGYEGLCSLAVYPDRASLHFARGAELSAADPVKLLQGRGRTVRHVALHAAAEFDRPEIQALFTAALKLADRRPDPCAMGSVIIRAEAQKRRAVRAAKKATANATPGAKKAGG